MTITTPASLASVDLYCASSCPTSVGIAPKRDEHDAETQDEPNRIKHYHSAMIGILESAVPELPGLKSAKTYPGTKGNTQGDRNETSPAKKAAIGEGRVDICAFIALVRAHRLHSRSYNSALMWQL
jgi:hypothetical protein